MVHIDQQSLKYLLELRVVGGLGAKYQRWNTKLNEFDFDIQYRSGTRDHVANALSKINNPIEYSNYTLPHWTHWNTLKEELSSNALLKLKENITLGK